MITFEEITAASKTIKTMGISKKDKKTGEIITKEYAEVPQRIKAFRMIVPNGGIETELLSLENGMCVFKATVRDENGFILGTGTAYEKEDSSFINQTSFIENCETSAVGRALAMCGFGIDLSVASYEEVATAMKNQEGNMKAPLINDIAEEVAPKQEEKKAEFPPRDLMLEVVNRHYPEDSVNREKLLKNFEIKKMEDATDVQLLAVYNKFGGK